MSDADGQERAKLIIKYYICGVKSLYRPPPTSKAAVTSNPVWNHKTEGEKRDRERDREGEKENGAQ